MSICTSPLELNEAISKALGMSRSGKAILEKAMECDDMFVYYTFINGKSYLTAIADRFKSNKQGRLKTVCLYANYPYLR